ncbi:MAG: hypothetical protein WAK97_02155, partial [Pseudolabrys sp.]
HGPRFTISLKRSTQNLQLSTTTPADYPIYWHLADIKRLAINVRFRGKSGQRPDVGRCLPVKAG